MIIIMITTITIIIMMISDNNNDDDNNNNNSNNNNGFSCVPGCVPSMPRHKNVLNRLPYNYVNVAIKPEQNR